LLRCNCTAAKQVGFVFGGDFANLCLTQESIERTLRALVATEAIAVNCGDDEDELDLRHDDYVRQFKVAKELGIVHPRPISEKLLSSMRSVSDQLQEEYTGKPIITRKRRKAFRPLKPELRASTRILSDPNTKVAEKRLLLDKKNNYSKASNNVKKTKICDDSDSAFISRLTQLQMCFDVDISQFSIKTS